MKYIVTSLDGGIMAISDTIGYEENGNPLVHSGTLAFSGNLVGGIYEVQEVPEYVEEYKYIYSDGQFAENPNYIEPIDPMNKIEKAVKETKDENTLILDLLSDHEYRLCMSELTGGENI